MTCGSCGSPTIKQTFWRGKWYCTECIPGSPAHRVRDKCETSATMDGDLVTSLMLNKEMYESRGDELRSGELELNLKGPREFWPVLPKRFY